MAFFPELSRLSPEELQHAFTDSSRVEAHGEEGELWLQEVGIQIADAGDEGIQFLLSGIPRAAECRLRAILLGLSSIKVKLSARCRDEILSVGRDLLDDVRPLVVMDAIDLLRCLDDTSACEKVLEHRNHASAYVVGGVLRYMAQLFPKEAVPLLEKALTSEEPIVRQNAIDELDELNCVQALPTIKRLLRDKDQYVRQAAGTAVKNLEG